MLDLEKKYWFVLVRSFGIPLIWYPVRLQGCFLVLCLFVCIGLVVAGFAALGFLPRIGSWIFLPVIAVIFLFYAVALKHTEFR